MRAPGAQQQMQQQVEITDRIIFIASVLVAYSPVARPSRTFSNKPWSCGIKPLPFA